MNSQKSYSNIVEEVIDFNQFLIETLKRERIKPVEYSYNVYHCPTCGECLEDGKNIYFYCPYCGQHLCWEKTFRNGFTN